MQVISLKVPVSKQLLIALDPFDLLISYNLLGHEMWAQPYSVSAPPFSSPLQHTVRATRTSHHKLCLHCQGLRTLYQTVKQFFIFSFLELLALEFAERLWAQNPTRLLSLNPDPIYIFYSLKSFNMSELDGPR